MQSFRKELKQTLCSKYYLLRLTLGRKDILMSFKDAIIIIFVGSNKTFEKKLMEVINQNT